MDPVTALGLACNVLDLVKTAISLGKVAKHLHDTGSTKEHEELESLADRLDAVMSGLQTAANSAKVPKSGFDKEITSCIAECTTQCTLLRNLLADCKPEKEGSWRSANMALFRTFKNKSKIDDAHSKLEGSRAALSSLFAAAA
jgi:hypothetical protein